MAESVAERIQSLLPDVLFNLGPAAKSLLRDPRSYIIGVVLTFIVNGFLSFAAQLIALVFDAAGLVASIPSMLADPALLGLVAGGDAIFMLIDAIRALAVGLVEAAGPLGPVVLVIVTVVVVRAITWGVPLLIEILSPRVAAVLRALIPGGG